MGTQGFLKINGNARAYAYPLAPPMLPKKKRRVKLNQKK